MDDEVEIGIPERMKELRKILNLSQKEFSSSLEITQGTISDIENGRKGPSREVLISLNRKFGVNTNWVLMGGEEEEIFVRKIDNNKQVGFIKNNQNLGVPFYNIDIAAHISEMFETEVEPSYFIDFAPFNDCTAYVLNYGESMLPWIKSGDILAIKRLANFEVLLWGEAHVIIAGPEANNLRTVKLIFPCADPSKMILRASNPDFRGDIIIDKATILSIYIVKGIITRKQW